jgi:hypothetical protein
MKRKRKYCDVEGCLGTIKYLLGGLRNRCRLHGGYPNCEMKLCQSIAHHEKGGVRRRCVLHGGVPLCLFSHDCVRPQKFLKGGLRGRCIRHGGYPKCQDISGCKNPQKYRSGGLRHRCIKHGGYPKCKDPTGCTNPQKYRKGGIIERCITHGGYPTCQHPSGCLTPQKYSRGGICNMCVSHGGYPRCSCCGLYSVKFDGGVCSDCNPNSIRAKRVKCEEERVEKILKENGWVYSREVNISFNCLSGSTSGKARARIDFIVETMACRILLEVDENQHKGLNYLLVCDLARMTNVMGAITCGENHRPTVWIRYNPNGFCVDGKKKRFSKHHREAMLLEMLNNYNSLDTKSKNICFEIIYMYFDTKEGRPLVLDDIGYSDTLKPFVKSIY